METDDDALRAYYERGMERDRLRDGRGELEFARTTEIVLRRLPAAPAAVADIGGGPGRYALWLASLGYQVEHRDLMPLHVEQLTADAAGMTGIRTAVGDVRDLDLPDASVDAVLLLGPLYHLTDRAERVRALRECARIVRPGGPVFAAAISRWAIRIDGMLRERLYRAYPAVTGLIDEIDRTGMLPPLGEGAFTSFLHRPGELREETEEAGLEVADLVSVEGPAFILGDLDARLADPADRPAVLEVARAIERVPELIGFGPHLIATGIRPGRF
ncbi:MAG TPA: class I SAM-dependent methyltransferase [Streptosporangiaceae bacterium]|nr:class I SAM-dependent methyltransferase [Streptosporangiaceae bacterium]